MHFLMAVKVLSDLCLYFGIVGGAAPWFGGTELFLLWPTLLCAGGVWLAGCGDRWPVLRFAGLLPPLTSLLLAHSTLEYILLAPALLYTCLLLLTGRLELEREQYHDFFFRSAIVAGSLSLVVISYSLSDWRTLLLFLSLYLLLGVFLMRQLRLDQSGWGVKGLNLLSLLGTLVLGGVLCGAVWLVWQLAGPVWGVVSSVLVQLLSVLVYAAAFLFSLLPSPKGREPQEVAITTNDDLLQQLEQMQSGTNPMTDRVLTIIGIVLAVLIAALVIWRMLKTTRRRTAAASRMVRSERIDVPREMGPGLLLSPREKVRRSYLRFMRLLLERGAELKESYTTGEINSRAAFLRDEAPADRLRQLYLTARYDQNAEITSQQAREARELVKAISRDSELN